MKMKQTTPYRTRSEKERALEKECVSKLLPYMTPVFCIYESFGGIGMLGQLLSEHFPTALIDSYELDADCVNQYRSRGLENVNLHHGDTRAQFLSRDTEFDAASLDFNQFTLLDLHRKEGAFQTWLLNKVFQQKPDWVHVTDSCCSKLHLNYKSYGLKTSDWEDYVAKFDEEFRKRWGYRVLFQAKHNSASCFLLVPE